MESFMLAETARYLFLLAANATGLPSFFVLSTEGHMLPPLPARPGVNENITQFIGALGGPIQGRKPASASHELFWLCLQRSM